MADETSRGYPEPDGTAADAEWRTYQPAAEETSAAQADLEEFDAGSLRPTGPRLAAHGVIVGVVAALLLVLFVLADMGPLVWLAGAGVAVGVGMVLAGYHRYRLDA